jgi:hypothetical protein
MAKLESAFDLAGKHVRPAAEITIAEDHQSAQRPKRSAMSLRTTPGSPIPQ